MAPTLNIHPFCLGPWQTNCYIVAPAGSEHCWIIDAGFEPRPMIAAVREAGLTPRRIVLTHAHVDHIAGLRAVREAFPEAPILIHEAEAAFLTDPALNLSIMLDAPVTAPEADEVLHHGDTLTLDGHRLEVRHTPGHSPGGMCLYQAEAGVVFAGDALFAGSIGRMDFPTSDGPALLRSIREQLLTLPDETRVYPGHGPPTTIGDERRGNPFLSGA